MIKKAVLALFYSSLIVVQSCSFLAEHNNVAPEGISSAENPNTAEGFSFGAEGSSSDAEGSETVLNAGETVIKAPKRYQPFSTDTLYSLIVAELAAGRQQYDVTLANYVREARSTGDVGVIARATRLAEYFRSHNETLEMGQLWLEQAPDNIEANSIVATTYIAQRKPLQALNYAEKILSLIDNNDNNANKLAAITETIVNYSREIDTLTRQTLIQRYHALGDTYPDYPSIKVGLSRLYEAQQDTATAYSIIQQVLATHSNYLPAAMQEIHLLQASEQTELAIEKMKDHLDKYPDNYRLRLLYARLLIQTDIQAAYEEFSRLSAASPKHLDIKFSKALIASELKKTEEAKQLFIELLSAGYRPNTVHYYLGSLAEQNKQNDDALNHYLSVKAGSTEYIISHSRAAQIMAHKGKLKQAQLHLSEIRATSPNHKPELYNIEADILESLDKIEPALAILTQAVNNFPDNINLRYSRSNLYEKTDQLLLMESDLRHILSLEPENAAALNALGYFLTTRTERHQEALDLIESALSIKPDDPAIIDSMGWALFNLGRTEEAIEYLRKAFELFPDPEVAAHLGEALWVNGNKQEARSIWTTNLKDNPNDSRILETMERLKASP